MFDVRTNHQIIQIQILFNVSTLKIFLSSDLITILYLKYLAKFVPKLLKFISNSLENCLGLIKNVHLGTPAHIILVLWNNSFSLVMICISAW